MRNRSRAVGRRIRELNRSLARRTEDAKQEVQRLIEEVAELAKASPDQVRRLLDEAQQAVTSVGRSSQRRAARATAELEQMIGLSGKVVEQIRKRFASAQIADHLVSLFDPDARPIRKGKRSKPNQFGCVTQYAELTANTRRGARGLLVPPKLSTGSAARGRLRLRLHRGHRSSHRPGSPGREPGGSDAR